MKLPYYELHITVESSGIADESKMERIIDASPMWHFSAIAGDPLLGPGRKLYATCHIPADHTWKKVEKSANRARHEITVFAGVLIAHDLNVIRKKIELVVFDTKESDAFLGT